MWILMITYTAASVAGLFACSHWARIAELEVTVTDVHFHWRVTVLKKEIKENLMWRWWSDAKCPRMSVDVLGTSCD